MNTSPNWTSKASRQSLPVEASLLRHDLRRRLCGGACGGLSTFRTTSGGLSAQAILRRAPPEFALAGLSMGGYIALEIMRIAPERVTRLALLDTSARPDTDAARQARGTLMDFARDEGMRAVLMRLMPNAVHPSRFDDKALVNRIVQMAWELGTDTFYRQTGAIMGRQDSRDLLKEIWRPTLVAAGDSDKITPPELAREMVSGIVGLKLMLFPECGHFSSIERPAAVTAALRDWLTA